MSKNTIFGNKLRDKALRSAEKQRDSFKKKFGDDRQKKYYYVSSPNKLLKDYWNLENLEVSEADSGFKFPENAIIVGNIRMGFGHYRIAMAIASACYAKGYIPYWMDLASYQNTTTGKIITHLNKLYSLGSKLSQKIGLFNKFYWEPLNSKGFKKLEYNMKDLKTAELMAPVCKQLPKNIPFAATHVWPAQAAVEAGLTNVVNVIPDNWAMGLHLAEGSLHTVQTSASYLSYRTLNDMAEEDLKPIPEKEIAMTGCYIDHELVDNLEKDTEKRFERIKENKPKRLLMTIGGAGAQAEYYSKMLRELLPLLEEKKVVVFINAGDHQNTLKSLLKKLPELKKHLIKHENDWDKQKSLINEFTEEDLPGVHYFYNKDIFVAVYLTNLLMRISDLLVTKPSELAYYPIPKLMIKRIGGHEKWGAIHAAEMGDGTYECADVNKANKVLKLMLKDTDLLTMYNENILKLKKTGTYNGAYKVVDLLVEKKK